MAQTNIIPLRACILAAGYGSRLRPYTNDTPKPLVKVAGRSLLDRTLDQLTTVGVQNVALNAHYLGAQIDAHMQGREDVHSRVYHEDHLLDTGGGIKNMITYFDAPFYTLSGDGLWSDAPERNILREMADAWDERDMDILIVLQPIKTMTLTHGVGDYDIDEDGRATRSLDQSGAYMFTSMRIHHPRIFDRVTDAPDGAFSYLDLLDKAQSQGRLHAIIHHGDWHHISTPNDLEAVDAHYRALDALSDPKAERA